jgi:hypothetical protein
MTDQNESTSADNPATGLHGRPSAAELVAAVREFLETDVMGATEGRVQFHARVAVNVLAMVEREFRDGPAQQAVHDAGLASLGVHTDAELAAAIRSGALDDRRAEVRAVVERMVNDRLQVANPKYARS